MQHHSACKKRGIKFNMLMCWCIGKAARQVEEFYTLPVDGKLMPQTPQYVASSTMGHLVEKQWWPDRQLSLPVMVVCTQNSGLDPDNKQKIEHLYPSLDYTELTTCGHFIHMEQPDIFNKKLLKFVNMTTVGKTLETLQSK